MALLCKVQANVKVKLFLSVWLLKERHNLLPSLLYFLPRADNSNLLIFLLYVVERMIDLLEWRIPTDAKLCESRLTLQGWHVVHDCLDLIRVEVESFKL